MAGTGTCFTAQGAPQSAVIVPEAAGAGQSSPRGCAGSSARCAPGACPLAGDVPGRPLLPLVVQSPVHPLLALQCRDRPLYPGRVLSGPWCLSTDRHGHPWECQFSKFRIHRAPSTNCLLRSHVTKLTCCSVRVPGQGAVPVCGSRQPPGSAP